MTVIVCEEEYNILPDELKSKVIVANTPMKIPSNKIYLVNHVKNNPEGYPQLEALKLYTDQTEAIRDSRKYTKNPIVYVIDCDAIIYTECDK